MNMKTAWIAASPWRALVILTLAAAGLSPARVVRAHGPAQERISVLTAAIARDPANLDLMIERADLYRETGNLSRSLADYDRVLRLDPARNVHLGRALVLLQQQRFNDALAAADATIVREPGDPRAWRVRAKTLAGLDRDAEAESALDQAIALADPPLPDDYLQRSELLASLESPRLDDAIAGLDEGLARLGPAVTLQLLAIELERQRGTFDSALARLDDLEDRYDRVETVLVLRGDVLAQAGRKQEADAAYTDALEVIEERLSNRRAAPAETRLRADVLRKLGPDGQ
jgi:tetratricopeptide (TPR) repeat protein